MRAAASVPITVDVIAGLNTLFRNRGTDLEMLENETDPMTDYRQRITQLDRYLNQEAFVNIFKESVRLARHLKTTNVNEAVRQKAIALLRRYDDFQYFDLNPPYPFFNDLYSIYQELTGTTMHINIFKRLIYESGARSIYDGPIHSSLTPEEMATLNRESGDGVGRFDDMFLTHTVTRKSAKYYSDIFTQGVLGSHDGTIDLNFESGRIWDWHSGDPRADSTQGELVFVYPREVLESIQRHRGAYTHTGWGDEREVRAVGGIPLNLAIGALHYPGVPVKGASPFSYSSLDPSIQGEQRRASVGRGVGLLQVAERSYLQNGKNYFQPHYVLS